MVIFHATEVTNHLVKLTGLNEWLNFTTIISVALKAYLL